MTICIACETTCPFLLAGLLADDGLKVLKIIVVVVSHAAAARTVSWQTFCKMSGKGKGKVVTARAQSQGYPTAESQGNPTPRSGNCPRQTCFIASSRQARSRAQTAGDPVGSDISDRLSEGLWH
jgi:hypothetical protein